MALADFVAEFEADPDMAARLNKARNALSEIVDHTTTFRRLRLAAGLSQAKLAEIANTSQAYIARIEAGTLDPGTDMLARLAVGLGASEMTVFAAVRSQRTRSDGPKRVG